MLSSLFKSKPTPMLGLDIGTRFVKAVLLEQSNNQIVLKGLASEAITGDAFTDREIKDFDAVANAIKKVRLALKNPKVKQVCAAVSGAAVLSKVVHMPKNQSDYELEAQLELEADSLIPFPIDDVYLDFERIEGQHTDPNKDDILLSVAHKNMIDSRITLLQEVEFEPKILDIEGYALGNALINLGDFSQNAITCCFCLGASQLQLTVVQNNSVIYSKELPFGVDNLLNDLCLVYNIDKPTAAQQLTENQLPENWRSDIYPQFLGNLQQQINRALQLYSSATHHDMPENLVLTGGGAAIEQLAEDLSTDLNKPIALFNPFEAINTSQFESIAASPQYAIAAGLACRSFNPCHI